MLFEWLLFFVGGPLILFWIVMKSALLAQRMAKRQRQVHADPHPLWNAGFQQDPPPGEVWPPAPHREPLTED